MGRVLGEIDLLQRIGREVVELLGIGAAADVFVCAAADHQQRGDGALAEIFPQHLVMAAAAGDMGQQASPVDGGGIVGRGPIAGDFRQGRQEVDGGDRLRHPARPALAGEGDDQRHAGRILMPVHLVPEPALAQHVAMIGGEEGDGLAFEPAIAQGLHQAAELIVDIGDGAVIGPARRADMGLGDLGAVHVRDMAQALPMGIGRIRRGRELRQVDLVLAVAVPIFRQDRIGIMGMGHGDDEAEGPVVGAARLVEEPAPRGIDHLLVEIELVGAPAGPGLGHREHVVVPARPDLRLLPIRRPAEIRGIDIRRQPLLEAMELVGAAEMHLAGEGRAVAGLAEVMGEGRNVGGEIGRIVEGPDPCGPTPRHHGEARGRAERAGAISGVEDRAAIGQRLDVGRLDQLVAVDRQKARRHLVGHDEEDVGASGHYWLLSSLSPPHPSPLPPSGGEGERKCR